MKLLVVRHAIAEERGLKGTDEERPVSKKGSKKFREICKNLLHLDWKFDLLLDSPLLRSQQTADIFCEYFPVGTRKRTENLRPLAEASDLLLEIKAYKDKFIVIVGHQPFLTDFVSHCIIERERNFVFLKKGGMALLDFPLSVESGSALLEFLFQPKLLLKKL